MEPSDGDEEEEQERVAFADSEDDDDMPSRGRAGFAPSDDEDDGDGEDDHGAGHGQDDSDEDDEEESIPAADDDDEDDDDDDEPPQAPAPKQKSMTQYFGGGAAAEAKAPASKRPAAAAVSKPEATRPVKASGKGASSSGGGGGGAAAAAKSASKSKGKGGRTFTHSDEEEDDSDAEMPTLPGAAPRRKQLELSAADPIEEHERLREAYANGTAGATERDGPGEAASDVAPKVADAVKSTVFIVKNDKGANSKRFYMMSHEAVVHALNFPADPYQVSPGDLVVSRKEREAELSKLADENIKKMISSTVICKVRVDGSGSGSGPGMTNLAAFLHVDPKNTQPQGYEELLEKVGVGETLDKPPTFLIMMDDKLVKRLYKFGKAVLPSMYDPNRHSNVKYRVLNKLEEQAKFDDHFKLATPITVTKGRKSKRPAEQTAAAAATANGEVRGVVPAVASGEETAVNSLSWVACGFPNVKMAKIKTNGKEKLQLVETSKPNEFLLFRID